ncbi:MAG: hypothetical protein IPN76_09935 [Saprospiraceae bacterium]|nr:hypothetical protein [Saprospiraceae bacterium]
MQYSAEETIGIINQWDETTKSHFHRLVSVNLTISIRVMMENDDLSAEQKLSEINLLNEFHHRLLSWWRNGEGEWQSAEKLFGLLQFYAEKMLKRGALEFPVASAFETVQGLRAQSN